MMAIATWVYLCHVNVLLGAECAVYVGGWNDREFPTRIVSQVNT